MTLAAVLGSLLWSPAAQAQQQDALSTREAKACMSCHEKPGITATYSDGEKRSVQTLPEHFNDSAHKFLPCTGCHVNQSPANHTKSSTTTREKVSLGVANACRRCHTDEQLGRNRLHKQILAYEAAVRCSDCHGSHNIQRVWRLKASMPTTRFCLLCHQHGLKSATDGTYGNLSVSEQELRSSPHNAHECVDCHRSWSKDEHPTYETRRQLDVAVTEACAGCHSDKHQAYRGSVHAKLVAAGSPKAPVCSDCHGSHKVGTRALFETLSGQPCKKCHADVFARYADSVHGTAREGDKEAAPLCASCHFAHEIKPAVIAASTRMACLSCHRNAVDKHRAWLPNVEVHFDSVACAACHVPNAERAVYLQVVDPRNEPLADGEIRRLLGSSYDDLLSSSAERAMEAPQLWELYKKLNRDDKARANMSGTVAVRDGLQAHALVKKDQAIKRCENCHKPDSKYFESVLMVVPKPDGTEQYYSVSPNVLQSVFSTLPLRHFYAIGNTRTAVLDWGGLAIAISTILGIAGHISLRLLTRRRRKTAAAKEH